MIKNPDYISKFWEKKILMWETLRYSNWLILYPLSWTVRSRLNRSFNIIKKRVEPSWSVLELGCGSGVLAKKIYKLFASYQGVDIAKNAIESAKIKIDSPNVNFIASNVLDITYEEYNLTIFLGLTDWLDESQMLKLFNKINSPNILFSYTETRAVSKINPYWYYRKFMDRDIGENSYKARTYTHDFICNLLQSRGYTLNIIESSTLFNPGAIVWAKK